MPKLWNETIEAYRRAVRDAILGTTAALLAEHGLRPLMMSQIAFETGVKPATQNEYFSGAEAILVTWHEHQLTRHFQYLVSWRRW